MNRYFVRLQQEHRRLNRLIDNCPNGARQNDKKTLKRLRLSLKDEIARLQRTPSLNPR